MDESLMLSQEAFEAEAEKFLSTNASLRSEDEFVWGVGEDKAALFEDITPEAEAEFVAAAKAWRATKFDAGFGWLSGPEEYGGRALPSSYERVFASLEARYDLPNLSKVFGIGLGMIAPTILAHGTLEVKQRYLRAMRRGDVIACQLMSEPDAGSDLAALSTRAVRDGDDWVINGQKVWTSGAQFSDIGEILCRTNIDAPKHKGITAFVIDMHAPGVSVRPLRQMTGGSSFNEVYFTDVRVPDSHRLGEVDDGWMVAVTTLMNERATIVADSRSTSFGLGDGRRLIEMLRHFGRGADPVLRQELAKIYIGFQVADYTGQRSIAKMNAGQLPGPELSIGKLAITRNLTAVSEFVGRVLGPKLVADTGEWGTYAWREFVLGAPGMRIAGGTDEVMRNIIGERVLGLAKEPSAGK